MRSCGRRGHIRATLDRPRRRHRAGQLHGDRGSGSRPRAGSRSRSTSRLPASRRSTRSRPARPARSPVIDAKRARGLRARGRERRSGGARDRAGNDLRRRRRHSLPRRLRAGWGRGAARRRRAPPAAGALPCRAGDATSARPSSSSRSTCRAPRRRRGRCAMTRRAAQAGAARPDAIERIERESYPTPWSRSMFAGELAKPSSLSLGAFDRDDRRPRRLPDHLALRRRVARDERRRRPPTTAAAGSRARCSSGSSR